MLLLALLLLVSGSSLAAENCELCHRYPGLEGSGRRLTLDKRRYASSPHAGLVCEDCHKGYAGFPHGPGRAARCDLPCHVPGASHGGIPEAVAKGPHGKSGGDSSPPCVLCHDDRSVKALTEAGTDEFCLRCHDKSDPLIPYFPYTTGSIGRAAHKRLGNSAPGCTACHDRHSPDLASARKACLKPGCHEGASQEFTLLYDHGGSTPVVPLAGKAKYLLWAGAALLALIALRGRGK